MRENLIINKNNPIFNNVSSIDQEKPEQNDISSNHPEIVKQMEKIMLKEHVPAINDQFKMKQLGDKLNQ